MSLDDDLAAIVARVADERTLLPRLEAALSRVGLLGDPTRLPELGRILRRARLTALPGAPQPGPDAPLLGPCLTDAEWEARPDEHRLANQHYRMWQAPPLGLSIAEWRPLPSLERSRPAAEEGGPLGGEDPREWAFVGVVSGAVCDRLLWRDGPGHCATCSCRETRLNTDLGFWRVDRYVAGARLGRAHELKRMHGLEGPDGWTTMHYPPHWLRASNVVVPPALLRPGLTLRTRKDVGL